MQKHDAQVLDDLIIATAGGDRVALARLYDLTGSLIFGLVRRILEDEGEAEEVTLDVYLQVWRTAAEYRPERSSPLAWLGMIARSRAVDRWRSGRNDRERRVPDFAFESEPAVEEGPLEMLARQHDRQAILAAFCSLPPEQRTIVHLAFFGGCSQTEIAEQLGMPLGTVKTHGRKALARLKTELQQLSPKLYD